MEQYDDNHINNSTLDRSINSGAGGIIGGSSGGKSSPHQSENTLKKSNLNVSYAHAYEIHR